MGEFGGIVFRVPGIPVADARPRAVIRAGKDGKPRAGVYKPKAQMGFAAVVRDLAAKAMAGRPPLEGPLGMQVVATFPWPTSTTKKRLAAVDGAWKDTKPDGDNIFKIIADGCQGICFANDSQIAIHTVAKLLGDSAGVRVEIFSLRGKAPGFGLRQ